MWGVTRSFHQGRVHADSAQRIACRCWNLADTNSRRCGGRPSSIAYTRTRLRPSMGSAALLQALLQEGLHCLKLGQIRERAQLALALPIVLVDGVEHR